MALTSPRFANVPQLVKAAANAPVLKFGARGHGVHLLQFALIDLGFPMPGSTGGRGMSPDGIYGKETAAKIREFQASNLGGLPVSVDGEAGKNTMAKLDLAIGGFTHRFEASVFTVKNSSISLAAMDREARKIYAHYGIKSVTRIGRCVDLKEPHHTNLHTKGSSFASIQDAVTKGLKGRIGPTLTTVVQIGRMTPDNTYAVTTSNSKAAVIRLQDDALLSTLAHEAGHVMLTPASGHDREDHEKQRNNLMTTLTRKPPFVLNVRQVKEMRGHARCHKI